MLISTRRPDGSLCIGRDIRITVLGIKGHPVRLLIRAPKDVVVDREEVQHRKQMEAAAALHPTRAGGL